MQSLPLRAPAGGNEILGGINDLIRFRPKVRLRIDRKHFTVKTVETRRELVQAYMLRYDVFHKEYIGRRFPIGVDTDVYDSLADLLVIVDNRSNKVVGTYRLICSLFSEHFYSLSEFDLSRFLAQPGVKLELSRACIHRNYRQGIVMGLLWKGLGEYMSAVGADYLFGCSSVKGIESTEFAAIQRSLRDRGAWADPFSIRPWEEYQMAGYRKEVAEGTAPPKQALPPLFEAYLRAGAKVHGEPALDLKFRCADFLTILDRTQLSAGHERKFLS